MIFRRPRLFPGVLLLLWSVFAAAGVRVSVCFNYGCLAQAEVEYGDEQLDRLGRLFVRADSPDAERAVVGEAVGLLLGWAGQQSPIAADRGGNYADDAVYGRMDCIDHATTTTRLLRLMENRRWLRFHRVLEPVLRERFVFFQHYSAQIEEIAPSERQQAVPRFVVDSWFFDNGQPAAVMPLAAWMAGEGPDVDK